MKDEITYVRLRIPTRIKEWMAQEAHQLHRSMNGQIIFCLDEFIKYVETKKAAEQNLDSSSTAFSK